MGWPSRDDWRPWGARGGTLPEQRRRGHLSAGHSVDRVVDEDDGQILTPIRRVDDLRGADGREIPVSLVKNHEVVRVRAFDPGGNGRSAAVGGLHHVDVEVVVHEHAATHRSSPNGLFPNPVSVDGFGDQPVDHSVVTAGAEMERLVRQALGVS